MRRMLVTFVSALSLLIPAYAATEVPTPPVASQATLGPRLVSPLQPIAPPLAVRLNRQLQVLFTETNRSPQAHASALAAQLLVERAARGGLSSKRWDEVVSFVEKRVDIDVAALSVLLPVAIATADSAGDENRQQKAKVWVRRFSQALPRYNGTIEADLAVILQRASLLEPNAWLQFPILNDAADKAEALEGIDSVHVSERALTQESGAGFAKATEGELKAAVAAWQPTQRIDSPVPQIVRLARWYHAQDRRAEAAATLGLATSKVNPAPDTLFRDTWAIALAMRDLKLPDSATWWSNAIAAAVNRDKAQSEPDQRGASAYLAATTLVVFELVKDGKLDDALAMTKQLDPELMAMNFGLNVSRIANAMAVTNFARAIEIAELLPPGQRRSRLLGSLAVGRAPKDLKAALASLEELSGEARTDAALALAAIVPFEKSDTVRRLTGEAIAAHLGQWKSKVRNSNTHSKLQALLADLPLSSLLRLEPHLKNERDWYADQLLANVMRTVGLTNHPLWQRFIDSSEVGVWKPG